MGAATLSADRNAKSTRITCVALKSWGFTIFNLEKLARALRKPWVSLETPYDDIGRKPFNSATKVNMGNVMKMSFWSSSWLNGSTPSSITPSYLRPQNETRSIHDATLIRNRLPRISRLSTLFNMSTCGIFAPTSSSHAQCGGFDHL
jgi:hypothetical protein